MPVPLPNGLVCPERTDPPAQACEQIKDLFIAVDVLQSTVNGDIPNRPVPKICQDISNFNWVAIGDISCKVYCQNVTTPLGVDTSQLLFNIYNGDGQLVPLCVETVGPNTIKITTNNPVAYKIVYA